MTPEDTSPLGVKYREICEVMTSIGTDDEYSEVKHKLVELSTNR